MLRLFRIDGHSLSPEYQPGDFVLVSKIPFFSILPGQARSSPSAIPPSGC